MLIEIYSEMMASFSVKNTIFVHEGVSIKCPRIFLY